MTSQLRLHLRNDRNLESLTPHPGMKYVILRIMRGIKALASVLLACSVVALSSACARRVDFTPTDLEEVQTKAGVDPLRVYVSKKLVAQYPRAKGSEQFDVRGRISESSRRDLRIVETTRRTMGQIIEIAERNGQPLLWVTFDRTCRSPDCAYGFVQTEDKRFRLLEVPALPGYAVPAVFYGRDSDKRRMQPGKLASLAEANEVFLLKKGNGDLATIDLEVIKKSKDEGTTVRSRNRGVELE